MFAFGNRSIFKLIESRVRCFQLMSSDMEKKDIEMAKPLILILLWATQLLKWVIT